MTFDDRQPNRSREWTDYAIDMVGERASLSGLQDFSGADGPCGDRL